MAYGHEITVQATNLLFGHLIRIQLMKCQKASPRKTMEHSLKSVTPLELTRGAPIAANTSLSGMRAQFVELCKPDIP